MTCLGAWLLLVLVHGPVVAAYVLLLRRGLRDQAAGLAPELAAEAGTGFGAVTDVEVPVLLTPARRWSLRRNASGRQTWPTDALAEQLLAAALAAPTCQPWVLASVLTR